MLNHILSANANLINIVKRQAPTYFNMAKPMVKWGLPAGLGLVWFAWPAGAGAYLFGIGAPKEDA